MVYSRFELMINIELSSGFQNLQKSKFLQYAVLLNFLTIIVDMITIPGVDPTMIANNLEPFEPTHPGELIKDELEADGISQAKLAENIGVSASLLNEVIKGKRAVNTELALLIEAAINLPADLLLNLQGAYNMQKAKSNSSFMQKLSSIRNIASVL